MTFLVGSGRFDRIRQKRFGSATLRYGTQFSHHRKKTFLRSRTWADSTPFFVSSTYKIIPMLDKTCRTWYIDVCGPHHCKLHHDTVTSVITPIRGTSTRRIKTDGGREMAIRWGASCRISLLVLHMFVCNCHVCLIKKNSSHLNFYYQSNYFFSFSVFCI